MQIAKKSKKTDIMLFRENMIEHTPFGNSDFFNWALAGGSAVSNFSFGGVHLMGATMNNAYACWTDSGLIPTLAFIDAQINAAHSWSKFIFEAYVYYYQTGNRGQVFFGLTENVTYNNFPQNGIYFYWNGTNGLYTRNINGGVLTENIPFAYAELPDSINKLRIEITAGVDKIDFYVNDSLVESHTTNLPKGSRLFPKISCWGNVAGTWEAGVAEIKMYYERL